MSETATEQTTTDATQDGATFEGEFDADKAKGLIAALRADKKALQSKVKAAEPGLAKLAELETAAQTETERWQNYAKQFEDRATKAEREALRASVALAKGLPANLAARLQGDDQAALEADADELLTLIPVDTTPRSPRPDSSQGSSARGNAAANDPAQQFAAFINRARGQ